MLVKEIVDILKAKEIYIDDQAIYQKDYKKGFSSDLMSDALSIIEKRNRRSIIYYWSSQRTIFKDSRSFRY